MFLAWEGARGQGQTQGTALHKNEPTDNIKPCKIKGSVEQVTWKVTGFCNRNAHLPHLPQKAEGAIF